MSPQEILDEIRKLGGRLEARGDRLHVEAPKGVLTTKHRLALAEFKPELLMLLQPASLACRLLDRCISIAIDRATGAALLILSQSGVEAVRGVASIYKPFEVTLTRRQRAELLESLIYLERLERRKESEQK